MKDKVIIDNVDRTHEVQKYEFDDKYVKIIFNGDTIYKYGPSRVKIIKSASNTPDGKKCLNYLKRIANEIGLKSNPDTEDEFNSLLFQYGKIDFVDTTSLFGAYLNANFSHFKTQTDAIEPIYPFGFNSSQKDAIDKALRNEISIIEGPPGTGKTQTILNIIANILLRGETVAIVSSNNSATKNVFDKLKKHNLDFVAACLGSKDNKNTFIDSQKSIPDMPDWQMTSKEIGEMKISLRKENQELSVKLLEKQELCTLKQELFNIEIEQTHFLKYSQKISTQVVPKEILKIDTSYKALGFWILCEFFEEKFHEENIYEIIKCFFRIFHSFGVDYFKIRQALKKYSSENLILMFQMRFFELRIAELQKSISTLMDGLNQYNIDFKMADYTEKSMKLFKAYLFDKYFNKERDKYTIDELKHNSEKFIQDYPIVLSTTYSLRLSLSFRMEYDYVIIDESSQVNVCTGALALSCARRAVIVGDLKQLSHVVDSKMQTSTNAIFNDSEIPEFYHFKNYNLQSSIMAMFREVPKTLLREHYRCHPKIIEFCNKKFYGGELIVLTEDKGDYEPLIVYKTVEGNHGRKHINQRQIDVIKNEVIVNHSLQGMGDCLGIISPYRKQVSALDREFEGSGFEVNTVDKFQGQEREVIILSTVDNEITEFVDNQNRLNVAISRAVKQLIVVTGDNVTKSDTNISDLVKYVEYNNFTIVQSKIHSFFDLLYHSYADRRKRYLSRYKGVSKYESENIIYTVVKDIFKKRGIHHLEIGSNVRLNLIFFDLSSMTEREKKFVSNESHADLLIYDSITKFPSFAIEIDSLKYHAEGSIQAERDNLKNEIFKKYGLPLLRLRTDGSGEVDKINEMLSRVLKG